MLYRVVNENFTSEDIDDIIDYCVDQEAYLDDYDGYEDNVNEEYGSITINGTTYDAYDILDKFEDLNSAMEDYNTMMVDNDIENARYDLRHMDVGDEIYIQGNKVVAEELDDEDEEDTTGDYDGDELIPPELVISDLKEMIQDYANNCKEEENRIEEEKTSYLNLFQTVGS